MRIVPGGAPECGVQGSNVGRAGRVRNARARAAAGYYDRPDVRERVLEAVLEELSRG